MSPSEQIEKMAGTSKKQSDEEKVLEYAKAHGVITTNDESNIVS